MNKLLHKFETRKRRSAAELQLILDRQKAYLNIGTGRRDEDVIFIARCRSVLDALSVDLLRHKDVFSGIDKLYGAVLEYQPHKSSRGQYEELLKAIEQRGAHRSP